MEFRNGEPSQMTQPAIGEEAAVGGYHYQYSASASLVLQGLVDGRLSWVGIKNVKAGQVDDFVVGSGAQTDGYQFKHRRAPATFTFRNLIWEEAESDEGSSTPQP